MKTEEATITTTTDSPTPAAPKATKRSVNKKAAKPATKKPSKPGASKRRPAKAETKPPTKKASRGKDAGRAGSKKSIVLDLLRRKEGATTAEIAKATNWQNHSIRGFISGTITKKMGLAVESSKGEAGERTYRIAE